MRAYSITVERIHGMDEVGVRFPVGPQKETSSGFNSEPSRAKAAARFISARKRAVFSDGGGALKCMDLL